MMTNSNIPEISVIIPTYNRKYLLKKAVKSVLSQSFNNFEIIIINDGGEELEGLIQSFNDSRILYLCHQENLGRSSARNTGLNVARGKYISYLDDDDLYYPSHLELHYSTLEQSGSSVSYSNGMKVTYDRREGVETIKNKSAPDNNTFSRELLFIENYIPSLCLVHKRELLEKTGLFDSSLHTHEDWDLWIRLALQTDFIYIPEVTCEYRWQHSDSTLKLHPDKFLESRRSIYNRYSEFTRNNIAVKQAQDNQIQRQIDLLEVIKAQKLEESNPNNDIEKSEQIENFTFPEKWHIKESDSGLFNRINNYIRRGKIRLAINIVEKEFGDKEEFDAVVQQLRGLEK